MDEKRGVAVSGTRVFYTEDSGAHWNESQIVMIVANQSWHKTTSAFENLFFLEGSDKTAWLSNAGGDLLKTNDGGRHWQQLIDKKHSWQVGIGFGDWGALYFATENLGWTLGGDGEVFETRDGGMNWTKLPVPARLTGLTGAQQTCWVSSEDKVYRVEWQK
jgi:photosystem II stability/assembly factor-like uncharacterized protein